MKELLIDSLLDALLDTGKLLPFLFATYLFMEWLEKKTAGKQADLLKKSNKIGPLLGGIFGVVPQCGFSLMASNLYSGGVIGAGVLLAVFMSTSDEMLPMMLSSDSISGLTIAKILVAKAVIAIVTGYAIGFLLDRLTRHQDTSHVKPSSTHEHTQQHEEADDSDGHHHKHFHTGEKNIHEMCEQEHCDCQSGVFKSAVKHTVKITLFIFLFTIAVNIIIGIVGEEKIASLFSDIPVVGEAAAALVGLVPNCAASVMITELYMQGILTSGAMMSGLLVSAGVGLAVLFRMNRHRLAENIKLVCALYISGVLWGVLINAIGITF